MNCYGIIDKSTNTIVFAPRSIDENLKDFVKFLGKHGVPKHLVKPNVLEVPGTDLALVPVCYSTSFPVQHPYSLYVGEELIPDSENLRILRRKRKVERTVAEVVAMYKQESLEMESTYLTRGYMSFSHESLQSSIVFKLRKPFLEELTMAGVLVNSGQVAEVTLYDYLMRPVVVPGAAITALGIQLFNLVSTIRGLYGQYIQTLDSVSSIEDAMTARGVFLTGVRDVIIASNVTENPPQ